MTSLSGRVGLVLGGLLTASAVSLAGGGVATAVDALVGQTYADATAQIKKWKAHPVLATVVGDVIDMNKCVVTSWRKDTKAAKIYLSLYCDASFASANGAGRSLGSEEGRSAKHHDEEVKWLRDHPDFCAQLKDNHPELFKVKPYEGCESAA